MVEERIINVNDIDYIVASDGKIYSTKNIGRGKYHKELKQRIDADGYYCITTGKAGHRKVVRVHRIIAKAFVPNVNNLPEVDHIDNNKLNNNASNLQWITGLENKKKTPFEIRSRTHRHELNGRAKINSNIARQIRELYKNGMEKSEIADKFKCSDSIVYNVVAGNTWKGI